MYRTRRFVPTVTGRRVPAPMKPPADQPVRVGVSACLLGQKVRYDGADKHHPVATDAPAWVEWVPVCPEVELGLGVPRPPIELRAEPGGVRLRDTAGGRDLTAAMDRLAAARVEALVGAGIAGYVLKARSPSCGLAVTVTGAATPGRGRFAAALLTRLPDLPVVEEDALAGARDRRVFFERVRAYHGRARLAAPRRRR
jgi:uncharacterized protein YbbK (DUF523 family)